MPAFAPRSAKNASVRIGNSVWTARKWEVRDAAKKLLATNFESQGFEVSTTGILNAEITIEFHPDGNQNPYDAPLNLQPGTQLLNVHLFLNTTAGPFWAFPTANVLETPQDGDVDELIHNTCRLAATGTFVFPTGSF